MKSMEHYSEKIGDAIEEGIGDKKNRDWNELLKDLSGEGKYQKTVAVISIIAKLAPDFLSERVKNMLPKEDPSSLPFNPEKLEFKNKNIKGVEHKVFLLEAVDGDFPSYVLKINYQNRGSVDEIVEKAKKFKEEYEEIKERYSSIPGLVPEELTFVTPNLKSGKPAIATVQKFLGTDLRDIVNDFKETELLKILEKNPKAKNDLTEFYEITAREFEESGIAVDLLGDKNLSLAKTAEGYRLVFLDPHFSIKGNENDSRTEEFKIHLERLGGICEKIA